MQLIVTIEEAMKYARSKEHFIALMEAEGYEVKWTDERKNITYTTPDGRKCRDSKLHEEKFLKENMEYEFRIRNEITDRTEGIGSQTDQESHRGCAVRNGHRGTLESDDRITENASRTVGTDTRYASEPCDEERTHEFMDQQIDTLTRYSDARRDETAEFQELLTSLATDTENKMTTAAQSITEQVGKANESFSRNMSSEKEAMEAYTKRLNRIALIPTGILVVWELIRLILSLI